MNLMNLTIAFLKFKNGLIIKKFQISFVLIGLVTGIILNAGQVISQPIDLNIAREYFNEYDSVCAEDGGQLWGINLWGPVMFAHKGSRSIVTNHPDENGKLTKRGDLYTGILPESTGIANTTQYWNGIQWTMVMWPLPREKEKRLTLIFHEAFHSIQKKLEVDRATHEAHHLDSRQGRIWQQLEWLALEKALFAEDQNRKDHIRNALIFRLYRRQLFPGADSTENDLEIMEGIPEYTGIKLSGRDEKEILELLSEKVEDAMAQPNFFRTFPYVSGPLYTFLLDESGYHWKSELYESNDLGNITLVAYDIEVPEGDSVSIKNEAHAVMEMYGGEKIFRAEKKREARSEKEKQSLVDKLVKGPVLTLPLINPNFTFNPGNMQPLGEYGTYYGTIRVVDEWGIIQVDNGALIKKGWNELQVSAKRLKIRENIEGGGWSLTLYDGWGILPGDRKGDYGIAPADKNQ